MPKFTYQGSPGYEFILPDRVLTPAPGDTVDLSTEEAEQLGDEFVPKSNRSASTDADTEGA